MPFRIIIRIVCFVILHLIFHPRGIYAVANGSLIDLIPFRNVRIKGYIGKNGYVIQRTSRLVISVIIRQCGNRDSLYIFYV